MAAVKLVTRCPACRTAFRLVADQLRLRQGLVRCGRCDTVFDARQHLIEIPAPTAPAQGVRDAAQTATAPAAPAGPADDTSQGAAAEPYRAPPFDPGYDPGYDVPALDAPTMMMGSPGSTTAEAEPAQSSVPPPEARHAGAPVGSPGQAATAEGTPRQQAPAASAQAPAPTWPAIDAAGLDEPGTGTTPRDAPPAEAPPAAEAAAEDVSAGAPGKPGVTMAAPPEDNARQPNEGIPDAFAGTPTAIASEHATRRWAARQDEAPAAAYAPDFLRHARAHETPRARGAGRRAWLLAGVVVLAIGAAAQATYLARSQLAGRFPALRPALEWACAPLGCTVAPWRDLDALRIDSSQLQKQEEGGDTYVLSVTLRNQGRATTALPAIELVMTDLQDQLLLRRVLQPAEYLSPAQRAFAQYGMRAGTELSVRVRFRSQQAAANYRVLLFYP
ncbi:DUF3426 domain-containing protein [Cupriavidus malaysiensis]|uniref:Zinc finger/thioredoxin putative domain-containing protein n=1 Tax=Cupriavidus malaysiensis TaxID=367825 RepID=A0ABM6F7Q1_9BURK|nr:DUF3426 domain-containing protein [Cupriavidus malaysiensis]AOZ07561.1 hypothetical protein BKK80_18275 [Cupriavidus malaysiensis]